jgi:hypothetical protein
MIIRSEIKHLARMEAIKVILNAVDYEGRSSELDFVPDPTVVSSGAKELETMEAQRIEGGRFTD